MPQLQLDFGLFGSSRRNGVMFCSYTADKIVLGPHLLLQIRLFFCMTQVGTPGSVRASFPLQGNMEDIRTFNHLSCQWKFSLGSPFQESELAEHCLPLARSVFTASEQSELELSSDDVACLAGRTRVSWKVCFFICFLNSSLGYVFCVP